MEPRAKRMARLFEKEDKGLSEAQDILAYLHRAILVDLNISLQSYERMVSKYQSCCNDPKFDKGNFVKSIVRDEMTLNSFIRAVEVIEGTGFKITLELKRKNREPSIHSIEVNKIGEFGRRRRTKPEDHY